MGRLRGKRNRDQDRYWHERRKAKQGGMVHSSVLQCCFCSDLLTTDSARLTGFGDAFCEKCGHARGLIQTVVLKPSEDTAGILQSIDAFEFERGSGGGPDSSGKSTSRLTVSIQPIPTYKRPPKATYQEKFQRELARELLTQERLLNRAILWLSRDATTTSESVSHRAQAICDLPIKDARKAILAIRWKVYRQRFPRPASEVPRKFTHAQVEEIRRRYATGTVSFQRLGAEYGCTGGTINGIVTGSLYKTAGGPIHTPKPWRNNGWEPALYDHVVRQRTANHVA